jgi:hypothetical protein
LISGVEWFHDSGTLIDKSDSTDIGAEASTNLISGAWVKKTYGKAYNIWIYCTSCTNATMAAQTANRIVVTGTLHGKGMAFQQTLVAAFTSTEILQPQAFDATFNASGAVVNTHVASIEAPAGGMGQFKGLTQEAQQKKYVQVICNGIVPLYATTYPQNLAAGSTSNGWVLSCYTGIAQCAIDITNVDTNGDTVLAVLDTATTTTISSDCMNDPRYLTWRVMTIKIKVDATQMWYRTDSYWNSNSTKFCSTWGTGLIMSTAEGNNTADNYVNSTTASPLGQTFVFAYADGSGVQFNHISYGNTVPTSNTTAGAGNNTLTTAPTSFKNDSPNMVSENYCGGSNLKLEGTPDTSALTNTITYFSDGYKATLTLNLEMFLPGGTQGWRGVCMVYYSSQYVQDNSNGAMCFAAQQDTTTAAGPTDFGAGYLMNVASSVWQPPANKASLQPSSAALSGGKYAITYAPSAITANIFTSGFYASVTWYQPKYASSYTDVARYGKDDYIGAYCMQGTGSNSYFSAPAAGVKLASATYIAVSFLSLGTALSLAM